MGSKLDRGSSFSAGGSWVGSWSCRQLRCYCPVDYYLQMNKKRKGMDQWRAVVGLELGDFDCALRSLWKGKRTGCGGGSLILRFDDDLVMVVVASVW